MRIQLMITPLKDNYAVLHNKNKQTNQNKRLYPVKMSVHTSYWKGKNLGKKLQTAHLINFTNLPHHIYLISLVALWYWMHGSYTMQ